MNVLKEEHEVELDLVDEDPKQPRRVITEESVTELATSITNEGQKQSIEIRVHPENKNRFMVVWGARRTRAMKQAGFKTIRARLVEYDSELDVRHAQIVENTARADLPPMEQAESFRSCVAEGSSIEILSARTGVSAKVIAADIEMAGITDLNIRKSVDSGLTPKATAREIATFPPNKQVKAWAEAMTGNTVSKQLANLNAYRMKSSQIVMGEVFDYTKAREKTGQTDDIVKAGKAYDLFSKRSFAFMKDHGNGNLHLAVKAREKSIGKLQAFQKELAKFVNELKDEIEACVAQTAKVPKNPSLLLRKFA